MLFYILVCMFSCIFIFLYSKIESKNLAFIFKWTSFLILFLPLALRYNIGVDYMNYVNHIINGTYENEFEIGWVVFIKFLLLFDIDLQWFFVVPAFLSLLIVFNFTEKKYTWIVVSTYTFPITKNLIPYEFLNHKFYIPENYDEHLRTHYGNYMVKDKNWHFRNEPDVRVLEDEVGIINLWI